MKQDLLNLYYVDMKYIRELHNADDKVMPISLQIDKASRPFLGVVHNKRSNGQDPPKPPAHNNTDHKRHK